MKKNTLAKTWWRYTKFKSYFEPSNWIKSSKINVIIYIYPITGCVHSFLFPRPRLLQYISLSRSTHDKGAYIPAVLEGMSLKKRGGGMAGLKYIWLRIPWASFPQPMKFLGRQNLTINFIGAKQVNNKSK